MVAQPVMFDDAEGKILSAAEEDVSQLHYILRDKQKGGELPLGILRSWKVLDIAVRSDGWVEVTLDPAIFDQPYSSVVRVFRTVRGLYRRAGVDVEYDINDLSCPAFRFRRAEYVMQLA